MNKHSIQFKGDNSSGIKINDKDGFLKLKNNLTIEAMVYVDENLKNGNGGCIVSNTENGGYNLNIGYYGRKTCAFIIKTNNWHDISFNNIEFITYGWHRVSATYNGNYMKLYLNGILKAQKSVNENINYQYNSIDLMIGNDPNNNSNFESNEGFAFTSCISDVRIWNKALDEKEVANLYNKYLIGNEKNLIAYWKLNNIEKNNIIKDYSKYNHDGVLYKATLDNKYPLLLSSCYKYLLKQNDKYYTIKSEFYKDGQYQDLGINSVTDDDFKNKGFEDLGELTSEVNFNGDKFKPIDKLKKINDGKFDIVMKEIE